MSVFGEREEGASASKASQHAEPYDQHKAERPVHHQRPASPALSCVSMKSDTSMGEPLNFPTEQSFTDHTTAVDRRMSIEKSASIGGNNSDPAELRLVLIGGRRVGEPSGKSSLGNIILGRDVFETNTRTAKSVMRQEIVSGRKITVVDTPGWISNFPLDLTPKLTQLEIQRSVYLCPPGPHAFVLVMPLDIPNVGSGMSAEEHVHFLLSDQVWKHTIVVFTVADEHKMRPDLIRFNVELAYLTKKCEGRFHVLNISDRADGDQVTELMEKLDQIMTSNGCHYETEKHVSEDLKKMERTIRKRAKQRRADAQKQTTRLPKHIERTDLKILLLGQCRSGKSSAGNTILGGSVFKPGQRSAQCKVRHGEVAGRHLTVVESPGWYYNSQLQDTAEMDTLEIQNSVCLYPPGPQSVILTVPLYAAFTKAQRVAVEEHMALLPQSVWSYSLVLFTGGDLLGDRSIEQHIEAEGEDLSWLVDKCGSRFHVFNNKKRDDTQVTELLEKIEKMVAGNQEHYEVDGDVSEMLSEKKKREKRVQTFLTKTHRQRAVLKALFEGEHQSLPDVRVMLVGGDQPGRSAAGNRLLQKNVFEVTVFKEFKAQTKLTECVRQQSQNRADRNVSVVNCPDWSTTHPSQKIRDVLLRGLSLCSPGPHAVLLNVPVKYSFSEADRRSVEKHMELLGDRVWRHAMVLFTRGYWLGERRVEEYIECEGKPLKWILQKCGYRYHVLDFHKNDISEVTELMEKIEDMATRNRGHFGPEHGARQKTLFKKPKGKPTLTEEEWKRREEELIDRMLKAVVTATEEPTLPAVRKRRMSKQFRPPSMSGGTTSETGSVYLWSPAKVSDWLLKRHPGPIASSSGYDTMSEVPSQANPDVMRRRSV